VAAVSSTVVGVVCGLRRVEVSRYRDAPNELLVRRAAARVEHKRVNALALVIKVERPVEWEGALVEAVKTPEAGAADFLDRRRAACASRSRLHRWPQDAVLDNLDHARICAQPRLCERVGVDDEDAGEGRRDGRQEGSAHVAVHGKPTRAVSEGREVRGDASRVGVGHAHDEAAARAGAHQREREQCEPSADGCCHGCAPARVPGNAQVTRKSRRSREIDVK
jgi:hypothetical protein